MGWNHVSNVRVYLRQLHDAGTHVSSPEILVLLTLAEHMAPKDSSCYPGIKTLADECHVSERQMKTTLQKLCNAGHVRVESGCGLRGSAYGGRQSNSYSFPFEPGGMGKSTSPNPGEGMGKSSAGVRGSRLHGVRGSLAQGLGEVDFTPLLRKETESGNRIGKPNDDETEVLTTPKVEGQTQHRHDTPASSSSDSLRSLSPEESGSSDTGLQNDTPPRPLDSRDESRTSPAGSRSAGTVEDADIQRRRSSSPPSSGTASWDDDDDLSDPFAEEDWEAYEARKAESQKPLPPHVQAELDAMLRKPVDAQDRSSSSKSEGNTFDPTNTRDLRADNSTPKPPLRGRVASERPKGHGGGSTWHPARSNLPAVAEEKAKAAAEEILARPGHEHWRRRLDDWSLDKRGNDDYHRARWNMINLWLRDPEKRPKPEPRPVGPGGYRVVNGLTGDQLSPKIMAGRLI